VCGGGVVVVRRGQLVAARARLMHGLARGERCSVAASEARVRDVLSGAGSGIAASMRVDSLVVSGPVSVVREAAAELGSQGDQDEPLTVSMRFIPGDGFRPG